MKRITTIIPWILIFTLLISCDLEDLIEDNYEDYIPTEFDGSIGSIEDFFNPNIVNSLQDLGFVIHPGNNPPNIIDGIYLASPFILQNSSVPGDNIGSTFQDYIITFFNQNSNLLTIDFTSENGNQSSDGYGSYISGSGNQFSIFLKTNTTYQGETAQFAYAISGSVAENGIENFQFANLMLDDNGDPGGFWIENNTGRLLHDGDSFSPLQGGSGGNGENGGAIFWINEDFGCGNINVNVTGVGNSTISGYYNTEPNCSDTSLGGNFNDLPSGNYSYTASCTNKNWSGSFTVNDDSCSKIELIDDGGSGNGTGDVIFWINQDYGCGPISVTVDGVGSTTISGFFPSGIPDCSNTNAGGNINNLPEGTYNFDASCTGYTWNGSFTITENGCFKQQLSL